MTEKEFEKLKTEETKETMIIIKEIEAIDAKANTPYIYNHQCEDCIGQGYKEIKFSKSDITQLKNGKDINITINLMCENCGYYHKDTTISGGGWLAIELKEEGDDYE